MRKVLDTRWVYDGCADPVWASTLATAILTGGTQAEDLIDRKDHLESRATSRPSCRFIVVPSFKAPGYRGPASYCLRAAVIALSTALLRTAAPPYRCTVSTVLRLLLR